METVEEKDKEENIGRCRNDRKNRMTEHDDFGKPLQKRQKDVCLGCLTKQHLIMISLAIGLLLIIITAITAVVLTKSKAPLPPFPTGGDMLDFLAQLGVISHQDGLLATWFHRANNKEEMDRALASNAMILEADVNLEGFGTQNQKPIPIMAHPPNIYSDNTLDHWLDAVLDTRKAIKLDFKSLASVGLSLDMLRQKNSSRGIHRPVWLNADILQGPNVPNFVPAINGTRFLQLIQEKFPDVTVSPGWQVLYVPPIFVGTYTRTMVEDMYNIIKDVPQSVTFPVHALLVRSGWQHISWLLSQSPRFSLTLWQGSDNPNISDLLFVRDNTLPARVYYDIYEPTLSEFKEATRKQNQFRRFYPGGNLMDFLFPIHDTTFLPAFTQPNSLAVHWFTVTDQASLLTQLSDGIGGMLIIHVASDNNQPDVPVVENSERNSEPLTLQHVLHLLQQNAHAGWGVYLRVHMNQILEASLALLHSAYIADELYRPVWISLEDSQSSNSTSEFISTTERLFPYATIVLTTQKWPPLIPAVVTGLSQRVALHLTTAFLRQEQDEIFALKEMDRYDFVVEVDTMDKSEMFVFLNELVAQQTGFTNTNMYIISKQS
ncbi:protein FAM151A [Menidia menidia]